MPYNILTTAHVIQHLQISTLITTYDPDSDPDHDPSLNLDLDADSQHLHALITTHLTQHLHTCTLKHVDTTPHTQTHMNQKPWLPPRFPNGAVTDHKAWTPCCSPFPTHPLGFLDCHWKPQPSSLGAGTMTPSQQGPENFELRPNHKALASPPCTIVEVNKSPRCHGDLASDYPTPEPS